MTGQRRTVRALLALLVTITAVMGGVRGGPAAGEQVEPRNLTVEGAVHAALRDGPDARRAAIELEQQLLQARNLELTVIPGGPFAPTGYDRARLEELLPFQGRALKDTARAGFFQQMASAQAGAVEGFYQLMLARAAVAVHETSLDRVKARLEQVEALYDRGVVPELDLLQARNAEAQSEVERFAAAEQAELALLRLAELAGFDLSVNLALLGSLEHEPREDLDFPAHLQEALSAGAEAAAARMQRDVARKDLGIFEQETGGYQNRRGYRERALAVEEGELALERAGRRVEIQLRSLYSRLAQLDRQIDLLSRQVDLARHALRVTGLQYEAGLTTITAVLDAEVSVRQAELAHLQAVADYKGVSARLDALLGRRLPLVHRMYEDITSRVDSLQ